MIFSVRVNSPNHINIEEGVALIRYLKWVLRATSRFCHRVVLLIDSKVVLGAISKGRSSSKLLNAIVRRAAARVGFALCVHLYETQSCRLAVSRRHYYLAGSVAATDQDYEVRIQVSWLRGSAF